MPWSQQQIDDLSIMDLVDFETLVPWSQLMDDLSIIDLVDWIIFETLVPWYQRMDNFEFRDHWYGRIICLVNLPVFFWNRDSRRKSPEMS